MDQDDIFVHFYILFSMPKITMPMCWHEITVQLCKKSIFMCSVKIAYPYYFSHQSFISGREDQDVEAVPRLISKEK